MKRTWLGFNKVLLGFSMTGGFILSIVAAVLSKKLIVKENEELWFVPFVVFVIGVLIVFGFHAIWGLLLEAAGNLANLPNEIAKNMGRSLSTEEPSVKAILSEPDKTNERSNVNDPWICATCHSSNFQAGMFCQHCGARKGEKKE